MRIAILFLVSLICGIALSSPVRSALGGERNKDGIMEPPYDSKVEYVYVDDGGFFVTPIKHSSSVSGRIKAKVAYQLTAILGKYNSGIGVYVTGYVTLRYNNVSVQSSSPYNNAVFDISFSNSGFSVNGDTQAISANSFSSQDFITIGQTPDNAVLHARTYYYEIDLADSNTTMHIVPVRLKDGTGGLYDEVSGELLERSSGGTFTCGPDL